MSVLQFRKTAESGLARGLLRRSAPRNDDPGCHGERKRSNLPPGKRDYFTDEKLVGARKLLAIEATIGPFFSVSARAFSHSGSAPNAPNFCSRSASDSHLRK